MVNELVSTTTKDKLKLNGLFVQGDKSKPVLLFIHGFESDFFSHKFVIEIANLLKQKDMSLLTIQTRGSFLKEEIITKDGDGKYFGSQLEILEESYLDIDAWIKFLLYRGYKNVILSGHSLGTIKAVRYMYEGEYANFINKIILFCPFDKNGQEDIVTDGKWHEYIKIAKDKIDSGLGKNSAPSNWEEVEMSYQTFYSWYKDENDLDKMFDLYIEDYNFPALNNLNIPVHIIVGSLDEFFYRKKSNNIKEGLDILLKNLKYGSSDLIMGAKHAFREHEQIVAQKVIDFLNN